MDDDPCGGVLDYSNMREAALGIRHVFTATDRAESAAAFQFLRPDPGFQALVGHPLAVFTDPAGRIAGAAPKHHLHRQFIKLDDDVRFASHLPQRIPLLVILELGRIGAEGLGAFGHIRKPPRRYVRRGGGFDRRRRSLDIRCREHPVVDGEFIEQSVKRPP